jgi:uncharacterized membrane protein YjfL (UPF0719 family)
MNIKVFSLGLIQLTLAILVGVLVLWFTFKIIKILVSKKMEIKADNVAFAIFSGAILLSVGLIMSESIAPAMNAYRIGIQDSQSIQMTALSFVKVLLGYLSIGLLTALIINLVSIWLYNLLTKDVDELTEIRNGNIATAIITAVIIIAITLMARDSLGIIFESFIPYPDTPKFY